MYHLKYKLTFRFNVEIVNSLQLLVNFIWLNNKKVLRVADSRPWQTPGLHREINNH